MRSSAAAVTVAVLVIIFHAQFGELCQTLNHDQCTLQNTDASISNLCFRKKCIRAKVVENSYCRTNAQCRRKYTPNGHSRQAVGCRKSRCYSLETFGENTPIRCRRRDDCTPAGPNDVFGYMCVRKTCVAVVRSNYSCRKRGRCGIGGRCMNGICYELWHGFTNPTTYLSDTDELPEYDGPDAFYTSAEEDQDDLKN